MNSLSVILRGCYYALLLAGISACTYLIPPEMSTPRNNTVMGDRHKPLRNSQNDASSTPVEAAQTAAISLPIPDRNASMRAPDAATNMPQFSDTTLLPAPNSVRPPAPESVKPLAAAAPTPVLRAGARVPVENLKVILAANDKDYYGLRDVPQRPQNYPNNGPSQRLRDARAEMEQARATAVAEKEKLVRDLAQEPTVFPALSPLPQAEPAAVATPNAQNTAAPAPTGPETSVAAWNNKLVVRRKPGFFKDDPEPQTAAAPSVKAVSVPSQSTAVTASPALTKPVSAPTATLAPIAAPASAALSVAPATVAPATVAVAPAVLPSVPVVATPAFPAPALVRTFDPMLAQPEPQLAAATPLPPQETVAAIAPVVTPQHVTPRRRVPAPQVAAVSSFNPLEGVEEIAPSMPTVSRYLPPSRYSYRR